MENYKDKLNSFATRIREDKIELPMQKVEPRNFLEDGEVQLNVYIPKALMKKLKNNCVERELKIKEFIAIAIERELN
jgi:hypothetical protein